MVASAHYTLSGAYRTWGGWGMLTAGTMGLTALLLGLNLTRRAAPLPIRTVSVAPSLLAEAKRLGNELRVQDANSLRFVRVTPDAPPTHYTQASTNAFNACSGSASPCREPTDLGVSTRVRLPNRNPRRCREPRTRWNAIGSSCLYAGLSQAS
jgi:hypothetical protein